MSKLTALEQYGMLHDAMMDLFIVICETLYIDRIVNYLAGLLDDR